MLGLSLATMMMALYFFNIQAMMVQYSVADKGEQIHITDGKYIGLDGWCWVGKNDTNKYTYVIVKLKDGQEKGTHIKKDHKSQCLMP